jgi:hypothetical protein
MIEFEFVPGQQVPKIVGEIDSYEEVEAEPVVDEESKELVSDPNDYSYLNGSKSPFYQPRNTDKNGAVPQATPTRSTGGQPSY